MAGTMDWFQPLIETLPFPAFPHFCDKVSFLFHFFLLLFYDVDKVRCVDWMTEVCLLFLFSLDHRRRMIAWTNERKRRTALWKSHCTARVYYSIGSSQMARILSYAFPVFAHSCSRTWMSNSCIKFPLLHFCLQTYPSILPSMCSH